MKRIHPLSVLVGAAGLGLVLQLTSAAQGPQGFTAKKIPTLTAEQEEILGHMSIVYLPDGLGGRCKTIRISGVNVQVVNGLGRTATENCLGNLIAGYNEPGSTFGDDRTGSHNIVTGQRNSYSSHGGIVTGFDNRITGPFCAVLGGQLNDASGLYASVTGGQANQASGTYASVSGGCQNIASGHTSKVCGGIFNEARAADASITGGLSNVIEFGSQAAMISGGIRNVVEPTAVFGAILGGEDNRVLGRAAAVSGGLSRSAFGNNDWVAGSLFENF